MATPLPTPLERHHAHQPGHELGGGETRDCIAASDASAKERMRALAQHLGRQTAAEAMRAGISPAPPEQTETPS